MPIASVDTTKIMHHPDVAIIDESINFNRAAEYNLLLQLGLEACSYALFDKEKNIIVSLHNHPFYHVQPEEKIYEKINQIFSEGAIISEGNFSNVFISFVNNVSTIVPEAILENGKEEKFLRLNHSLESNQPVFTDKINLIDAVNIYSSSEKIYNLTKFKFPDASYRHFSSNLIENLIIKNKHKEDKQVTLHVQASHFEVIVTQGKSLLFYNSFNYKAPEDILYFLLNVFEQLQLNPETVHLHLTGEIEKRSGIYNLLEKYIRFIEFGKRPDNINFSYGFHDIPPHYYYSLFSLATCV